MRQLLLVLLIAVSTSSPALAQRVLVLTAGGDADPSTLSAVARAVETAVRDAMPDGEVMTTASLQTSIAVSQLQDCTSDEAVGACISEIADAAAAEAVIRPHLGRLGDEFLLTLTVTGGSTARLMAQGQRRANADRPSALLDVIPQLASEVLVEAGLARPRVRQWPVAAIGVGVGGAVLAGIGGGTLLIRSGVEADYDRALLSRDNAAVFEALDQPVLVAGVGVLVIGATAALIGAGMTVWGLVQE